MLNSIDQTVDLLRQIQDRLPNLAPDEWVGFEIDGGQVMAGKNFMENPQLYRQSISRFERINEWREVAEVLDLQSRFRQTFFSLSENDMNHFKQVVRETMSTRKQ